MELGLRHPQRLSIGRQAFKRQVPVLVPAALQSSLSRSVYAPEIMLYASAPSSLSDPASTSTKLCSTTSACNARSAVRSPISASNVRRRVVTSAAAPAVSSRLVSLPFSGFDSIPDALADLALGKFVVVLDDEHRENEGDLIMNADRMTTASMAFLVEHSSGVVCISMEGADLDRLKLPLMVTSAENEESMYTAFTVSVDLREGTSTGISAADRAATVRALADPAFGPQHFRRPGHIFPLRYRTGGVLVRPGHTEAAVDLARLSGSYPAGVLCEIVNKEDGSMARTPQLLEFAKRHGLRTITIADLIRYLKNQQP